jgi:GH24 family phage-related lysozyme (muramidase)
MNSLVAASSLVPGRKELLQPLEDQVARMDLSEILSTLVLPKDEQLYANNLVGVIQRFKKKDDVPKKELTTGVIESFREYLGLKEAAEGHQNEGISILKRIAKWGLKRIVKWLFKTAFRLMYRFTRWVFKEVITRGVKALVEWVVRPVLMSALEFIGVNPEIWPFIALAGGVAAIGFAGWNMFFAKPKDSKVSTVASKADSLLTDQAEVARGIQEVPLEPTTEAKPTVAQRAAAPLAAGAPVAVPTGPVDNIALTLLKRHEGYKTRPYRDSEGYWTIGIGHLITKDKGPLPPEWDREFSDQEVLAIFAKDYAFHKQAAMKIPGFDKLDAMWQAALIDMTFNMGPTWWHSWKMFQQQLLSSDLVSAIKNLAGSVWAQQTKSRAVDIINLLSSDLGNKQKGSTEVATATPVKQSPGVSVAQAQPGQSGTAQSAPPVGGSLASTAQPKNYIKGPQGSIVAVS